MAISVRGVIPEKSSHCSPLQPTLTWQFQSGGGGGNSSKVLPLQPNSYIILPPLNKLPPHSYINLPPIDKLPPPPPTLISKWEDFREDIRPGRVLSCKHKLTVGLFGLVDSVCSVSCYDSIVITKIQTRNWETNFSKKQQNGLTLLLKFSCVTS